MHLSTSLTKVARKDFLVADMTLSVAWVHWAAMKTLGLDLGPNSIGWALVEEGEPGRLIDCGVRVFPAGVDNFDSSKEMSRNEQRRNKRMMRRQTRRRAARKRVVAHALAEAGLLPADPAELAAVLAIDPYPLRSASVERELSPHEIGRVIYHLNKRRGFLSLRKVATDKVIAEIKKLEKNKVKAEAGDAAAPAQETDSAMLASIELLARQMGTKTLGAFLHDQQSAAANLNHTTRQPIPWRIRGKHTRRSMLEDELLRVWQFQKAFHPGLLTDEKLFGTQGRQDASRTRNPVRRKSDLSLLQQFGLHGLVFHQRPIYWPREMIGMCELEKGCRRAHRTDRRAQRFRMLQEINNLRYDRAGEFFEKPLDESQREKLLTELYKKDKFTFDQIRKLLGMLEGTRFNLERGERSSLKGCETDFHLTKVFAAYEDFDEETKDQIARILIDAERDEAGARDKLVTQFNLTEAHADALLTADLPGGYVRFSVKAIDKLMPHLERGLIVMGASDADESAMHAAGYLRRDELERRLFEKLPSLSTIRSGQLADLPNPVVAAAMYELRKVVNAIIKEYGKPDAVHVEMARSMKMSSEKRKQYSKDVQTRGREREVIADDLRAEGVSLSRDSILRVQLWEQQKRRCIYSGQIISRLQLFNGETDLDHILPYSITLDDSQSNKVVVFRNANRDKGQRSPHDWLAGSDPARLKQIEQWGESLPWTKRRKLTQQEIKTDDFIARQLVDTAYIARLAVTYLELIVEKKHDVQGRKGTYTADLRYQWGLDTVLQELPDSPAWQARNELRPGEKNRADHRHHAIDAIVIALTNRKRLVRLGKIRSQGGTKATGEILEEPWTDFRNSITAKIRTVNVSHRVRRGVNGALHEETQYGPVHERKTGLRREGEFVMRKPVETLSLAEVEKIRDGSIKDLVIARLAQHGITPGRDKEKLTVKKMQEIMKDLQMPSGVPVRKVRIVKKEGSIQVIRKQTPGEVWVKPGSIHHICIFEWEETNKKGIRKVIRESVFVSMLEARRRIKSKETIINRTHPTRADARFVMSLSGGEVYLVTSRDSSSSQLMTFKTGNSESGQLWFAHATDARKSSEQTKPSFLATTLTARKVTVDPLGRIRWAND